MERGEVMFDILAYLLGRIKSRSGGTPIGQAVGVIYGTAVSATGAATQQE